MIFDCVKYIKKICLTYPKLMEELVRVTFICGYNMIYAGIDDCLSDGLTLLALLINPV